MVAAPASLEGCTGKKQGCRLGENAGFMTGTAGASLQKLLTRVTLLICAILQFSLPAG